MQTEFRMCTRCVMDTTDPDIVFDAIGVCNHCHAFDARVKTYPYNMAKQQRDEAFETLIKRIKEAGKNNKYDCVIGVSGGVDSTYLAYMAKEHGLKPIAVHVDNGWNSELAVDNIKRILKSIDVDLFTYVIDWEEFKDIQLSFLKASVPDGEIPTDHSIHATLNSVAAKNNVKYILIGTNLNTEAVHPEGWTYGIEDYKYISAIQKTFGTKKIKSFPHYTFITRFINRKVRKIKYLPILDYMDYDKESVIELLKSKLGWRDYGGKHFESVYTRFYHGYVINRKFKIDKRKAHLSSLIFAKQLTKDQALEILKTPLYDEKQYLEDRSYVIKKFNLTNVQFEEIMCLQPKSYKDYPNCRELTIRWGKIKNMLGF